MVKRALCLGLCILFLFPAVGLGVETNPLVQGYLEGYLLGITPAQEGEKPVPVRVQMESYAGSLYLLDIAPGAVFTIDNIPAQLSEFRPGMEIYAGLQGKSILSLEGYSTANLGYIPPGSRIRTGVVMTIDRDQLGVRADNGSQATYYTSAATLVHKRGQLVELEALYVGDRVRLYFDELETDMVSRLEVEGDSNLVRSIYKARLAVVDSSENRLGLEDIKVLNNGAWQAAAPLLKLEHIDRLPVYTAGAPVPLRNLKYYRGRETYLLVKNVLGQDIIDRMIIKNQYEAALNDQIKDINWYGEVLELKNNKNISFNEGSIIIKNGRVQDKTALHPGQDVLVLADGRGGSRIANVVYVYNEDLNPSNISEYYLYCGQLDQIYEDGLWLKSLFILENNSWKAFNGEKELFYDSDTGIYDVETGGLISPQQFYAGDYAVDEDSDRVKENRLRDWYAYVFASGDRVASIAVQKQQDSLLRQRVTAGTVKVIEEDPNVGWVVTLGEARDWSNHKGQWMPKNADLRLNLQKALLIRNGKVISPEELRSRERVYLVRDDFRVKVLLVK